jgi:chromosome segregation ATPase
MATEYLRYDDYIDNRNHQDALLRDEFMRVHQSIDQLQNEFEEVKRDVDQVKGDVHELKGI